MSNPIRESSKFVKVKTDGNFFGKIEATLKI